MVINSLAGHFFEITDFVLVFLFEPSPPHNSQHIDGNQQHNEDNTYYHIQTHTDTCSHNQTQSNTYKSQTHHPFPAQLQVYFIPSGTRLAQLFCQDSCFLHDANIIAEQEMDRSPHTLTLRTRHTTLHIHTPHISHTIRITHHTFHTPHTQSSHTTLHAHITTTTHTNTHTLHTHTPHTHECLDTYTASNRP